MSNMPETTKIAKAELDELTNCLSRIVGNVVAIGATFAEREAETLAVANEAVREVLQAELQQVADGLGDRVRIDDVLHARHEEGIVGYHSLCGPLPVKRWTYREVGVRNGPTVVPLALAAGLIERMTPALAQSVAVGFAKDDLRSHEDDLRLAHGKHAVWKGRDSAAYMTAGERVPLIPSGPTGGRQSWAGPHQPILVDLAIEGRATDLQEPAGPTLVPVGRAQGPLDGLLLDLMKRQDLRLYRN